MFRFVQVEVPWELGPPDGRYLLRTAGDPGGAPSHVLVLATLGARTRRGRLGRRRPAAAEPNPTPADVATGRATVIDVARPLAGDGNAAAWLERAGEDELAEGLAIVNRALHAFRLAAADPFVHPISRRQAIAARVGYGAGEQVAEGRWSVARELPAPEDRQRRRRMLAPDARLAAMLGGHEVPPACEELTLRARLDLDQGRRPEAALQLLAALDAALAELPADPHADALAPRLDELRAQRDAVAAAAGAAARGELDDSAAQTVAFALGRLQAALRARVAARRA